MNSNRLAVDGGLNFAVVPGFNGAAGYIRYRASGMMSAHHD